MKRIPGIPGDSPEPPGTSRDPPGTPLGPPAYAGGPPRAPPGLMPPTSPAPSVERFDPFS